jgi:DNA-binding MarR family transcriptional regulator
MKSEHDSNILAQQIMEVIPLVMRTVAAKMRQNVHVQMTSHFHVLWILKRCSMSLSDLAEKHSVSLPTMSNSITTLEERGWVTRTRSSEDRRKVMIEITPAGLAVLAGIEEEGRTRVAEILADVSEDNQEKLSVGLSVLRDIFLRVAKLETAPEDETKQPNQT